MKPLLLLTCENPITWQVCSSVGANTAEAAELLCFNKLLFGLGSSDGLMLMLKHMERTHRGGTSQTPLSSWGALLTPREPAAQAVRDGGDRPTLIPVLCWAKARHQVKTHLH